MRLRKVWPQRRPGARLIRAAMEAQAPLDAQPMDRESPASGPRDRVSRLAEAAKTDRPPAAPLAVRHRAGLPRPQVEIEIEGPQGGPTREAAVAEPAASKCPGGAAGAHPLPLSCTLPGRDTLFDGSDHGAEGRAPGQRGRRE